MAGHILFHITNTLGFIFIIVLRDIFVMAGHILFHISMGA